jgi:hypothetical protein
MLTTVFLLSTFCFLNTGLLLYLHLAVDYEPRCYDIRDDWDGCLLVTFDTPGWELALGLYNSDYTHSACF